MNRNHWHKPTEIAGTNQTVISSYNQLLNIVFIFCLVIIIFLKFFVTEFFTAKLANAEDLITKLCFAFIASYIFYNVVTKNTDRIRKREAYAVICGLIDSVIKSGNSLNHYILLGAGKDTSQDMLKLTDDEFKHLCSEVDLNLIPKTYSFTIGMSIIQESINRIKFFADKIYTYMPFLDSEILYLLSKLQNSKYTRYIIVIPHKQTPNLKEFHIEIREFLNTIREIEIYNSKLKRKYLKNLYERRTI